MANTFDPTQGGPYSPGGDSPATFDPSKAIPFTGEAPPIGQWPGVIARTYDKSIPGFVKDMPSVDPMGEAYIPPVDTSGAPQPSTTQEPRYSGPLGYGQQFATTASNPLTAAGAVMFPLATLGGDIAHEAARQYGANPFWQDVASAAGGASLPGLVKAGMRLGASLAPKAASIAEDLADSLTRDAGVVKPISPDPKNAPITPKDIKDAYGQTIQDAVGEKFDLQAAAKPATAKKMATRAAQTTTPPTTTPGDEYLKTIDNARTPSLAVDAANSRPDLFRSLPDKAKKALGAYHANEAVRGDPGPWQRMDPAHQAQIVGDQEHRSVISAAGQARTVAQQTADAAKSQAGPSTLSNLLNWGVHKVLGHGIGRGIGMATLGHFLGLGHPATEALGAAATAIPAAGRFVARHPIGTANALVGGTQGQAAGPDNLNLQ